MRFFDPKGKFRIFRENFPDSEVADLTRTAKNDMTQPEQQKDDPNWVKKNSPGPITTAWVLKFLA